MADYDEGVDRLTEPMRILLRTPSGGGDEPPPDGESDGRKNCLLMPPDGESADGRTDCLLLPTDSYDEIESEGPDGVAGGLLLPTGTIRNLKKELRGNHSDSLLPQLANSRTDTPVSFCGDDDNKSVESRDSFRDSSADGSVLYAVE